MNVVFAVGCSNYDDPDVATLKYASKDAQRFADTVKRVLNPDDTRVFLLHDELQNKAYHPTRGNILRYLSWRARLGTRDELESFYFFFSGHGFHSLEDEVDYLFASDSSGSALEDTAISFITLEKYMRRWEANYTVLFVDACRAAAEGSKGGITIENASKVDVDSLCPSGMVTFCSCRPGQASYEADAIRSGVFTEGICRALGDNGKCSTIEQLDAYLIDQIPKISEECARPPQAPYSKLEPLAVRNARIVSRSTFNNWQIQEQEEQEQEKLTQRLMETTGSPDAFTQSASDVLSVGRPSPVRQEEQHALLRQIFSIYNTQRLGIATIAFVFPLVLWVVGKFNGLPLQDSMSAYYWASIEGDPPVRVWYIGGLFAIGSFLFLYKGYSLKENIVLNLAALFAIGVALFPMPWNCGSEIGYCPSVNPHSWFFIAFFGCIAYVAIFRSGDTLHEVQDVAFVRRYKRLYRLAGALLILSPLLVIIAQLVFQRPYALTYFLELFGFWSFALFWLLKTLELSTLELSEL